MENGTFGPAVAGTLTVKWFAAAAETASAADAPVMLAVAGSAAGVGRLPAVSNVALKVPTPLANVAFAGRIAEPSLLVKCTVPAYPVTVAFEASRAVTLKLNAAPAVAAAGALTVKCVAVVLETAIVAEVPVIDDVTVSVAVIVWLPAVFSVALKVPRPLVRVAFAGRTAAASLLVK